MILLKDKTPKGLTIREQAYKAKLTKLPLCLQNKNKLLFKASTPYVLRISPQGSETEELAGAGDPEDTTGGAGVAGEVGGVGAAGEVGGVSGGRCVAVKSITMLINLSLDA